MEEKLSSVLVIVAEESKQLTIRGVLAEQNYRVVIAKSGNEARLKVTNEEFAMLIIDNDIKGVQAAAFIEEIRNKEKLKSIKELIPILIISMHPAKFTEEFALADNVSFMEAPFSSLDFKKKLVSLNGKSNVISSNTKKIDKGDYIIIEGGNSHEMYWVLSGKFQISKLNEEGESVKIGEVNTGELVGEMSFLDNLPRSASVRAAVDSEVLTIPHKKFIDVLEGQPRWFKSLMQTMSQRLRETNEKVASKSLGGDDDSLKANV